VQKNTFNTILVKSIPLLIKNHERRLKMLEHTEYCHIVSLYKFSLIKENNPRIIKWIQKYKGIVLKLAKLNL